MDRILKQAGLIIIGIGILILTNFALKSVKNNNISKLALDKYFDVVGDVDRVEKVKVESDIIIDKFKGYDHNDELIAYLYEVSESNSYGNIRFIIAINSNNGKVIGMKALEVGQTIMVDEITNVINGYKDNVEGVVDGLAGATYAKDTINNMLGEIAKDFKGDGK